MFIQFPMAKTSKQECMKTLAKMGKDLLRVILEYLYKKMLEDRSTVLGKHYKMQAANAH